MVSVAAILSLVTLAATWTSSVHGHGYMEIPLAEFKDKKTSEWIVEIEPQWEGEWTGADEDRVKVYKALAAEKGVGNIRSLLDSDTSLYGADCGYTDPDASPKDIPTDGTATLSRGIVHAGPCEIWLDDTLAMTNDDCQAAYGGSEDPKSVFPVDYSSCSSSGCMLRFYWLAFQSLNSKGVWQVYKDCVPLKGGSGSSTSTTSTTTSTSTAASSTSSAESDGENNSNASTETSDEEGSKNSGDDEKNSDDGEESSKKSGDESKDEDNDEETSEESNETGEESSKEEDSDSSKNDDSESSKNEDSESSKEEDSNEDGDSDSSKESSKDEESDENSDEEVGGEAQAPVTTTTSKCNIRSRARA